MKGDIRVFKESGIVAKGNVLPLSEFKLFSDMDEFILDKPVADVIIRDAEKYLEEPVPYLTLSLYRDFFLTGVRSRYEGPCFKKRDMLFYLFVAEMLERKGRFTEKLVDVIWSFMEQTEWCIPAHYYHSPDSPYSTVPTIYNDTMTPALELYSGSICGIFALITHYLKDELDAISTVIVTRMKHQIFQRGIRPFMTIRFSWNGSAGFANNWVTNITQNILLATALTVEDMTIRERVVEIGMHYLDNFTSYYPEDGSCDEGPAYWGAAPANLFDALEILEDMSGGKINVYNHPLIKKMGEYIVNFNIHDTYFINFADSHARLEQCGKMLTRYGKKCNSEDLYAFGKFTAANNKVDTYYYGSMGYRNLKNLYTPRPDAGVKTAAKPAVWYDGNVIAIFREKSDTGAGLFLACKGGTNGEAHNHLDVGCIVVYSNGQPVIIDPAFGSYNNYYFGKERYNRWYTKSSYHSIPSVDGYEEGEGRAFTSKNSTCDLENKIVSMDLADAFPAAAGVEKMIRTCQLGDGFITVTDDVVANHEADIQFNYLCVDKPEIIDNKTLKITDGRTFAIESEGYTVDVEKVENTYLPYEDLSFKHAWNRECLWRIVIKAKATAKSVKITIS